MADLSPLEQLALLLLPSEESKLHTGLRSVLVERLPGALDVLGLDLVAKGTTEPVSRTIEAHRSHREGCVNGSAPPTSLCIVDPSRLTFAARKAYALAADDPPTALTRPHAIGCTSPEDHLGDTCTVGPRPLPSATIPEHLRTGEHGLELVEGGS
jgi:hypothetical protein